jgi:hypothetical protein
MDVVSKIELEKDIPCAHSKLFQLSARRSVQELSTTGNQYMVDSSCNTLTDVIPCGMPYVAPSLCPIA